jgi:hypothetical protein
MGVDRTPTLDESQRALIVIEIKGPLNLEGARAFDQALKLLLEERDATTRVGVVRLKL